TQSRLSETVERTAQRDVRHRKGGRNRPATLDLGNDLVVADVDRERTGAAMTQGPDDRGQRRVADFASGKPAAALNPEGRAQKRAAFGRSQQRVRDALAAFVRGVADRHVKG